MFFRRLAATRPFLCWGMIAVAVMLFGGRVPLEYDSWPWGTFWFAFTYVVTVVFQVTGWLAQAALGWLPSWISAPAGFLFGVLIYWRADRWLTRYSRDHHH